jgi:hypothetical protein
VVATVILGCNTCRGSLNFKEGYTSLPRVRDRMVQRSDWLDFLYNTKIKEYTRYQRESLRRFRRPDFGVHLDWHARRSHVRCAFGHGRYMAPHKWKVAGCRPQQLHSNSRIGGHRESLSRVSIFPIGNSARLADTLDGGTIPSRCGGRTQGKPGKQPSATTRASHLRDAIHSPNKEMRNGKANSRAPYESSRTP